MTDTDGTCEYVLDPDDPETARGRTVNMFFIPDELLNENGTWNCPHEAEQGEELCIFHLDVDKKEDNEVINKFFDAIGGEDEDLSEAPVKSQFLGAQFGKFDLDGRALKTSSNSQTLFMNHVDFVGKVDMADVVVGYQTDFKLAKFNDQINFHNITFESSVEFRRAVFEADADFHNATFKNGTDFMFTEFESDAIFRAAEFGDETEFEGTVFGSKADFSRAVLNEINFWNVEFGGRARYSHTKFRGDISFRAAEFRDEATFKGSKFSNNIDYEATEFDKRAYFNGLSLEAAEFGNADLTDSDFTNATLCEANLESALLSRATLFGADLRGTKLSGTVLGDVRINEDTKLLGHPAINSEPSPHTLSAIRSQPTCVYDPDYEEYIEHTDVDKAKSVYRALEELGGKHARPRLQARSFVRRQDLQKNEYKQDAKQADSWEERLIAGARYSRAKVARATLLYGESPWRVIAYSLSIILGFALLFPLGGWMKPEGGDPITYAQIASNPLEILNSVYYSTLTFTALGFGDFKPVGLGRALTTIETGLGAVLLALLVFILGRRAAR